jgi:hypothetical protein
MIDLRPSFLYVWKSSKPVRECKLLKKREADYIKNYFPSLDTILLPRTLAQYPIACEVPAMEIKGVVQGESRIREIEDKIWY